MALTDWFAGDQALLCLAAAYGIASFLAGVVAGAISALHCLGESTPVQDAPGPPRVSPAWPLGADAKKQPPPEGGVSSTNG